MRKRFVAGNWKLNGSQSAIETLLNGVLEGLTANTETTVVVCAPYIYIPQVAQQLANTAVGFGAQDVSEHESGAYTGEVSSTMLKEFACQYAIIGHSERRSLFAESDQESAAKFAAARQQGLTPIFCIGESLDEREAGITESVVARQLDAVIDLEGVSALKDAVLAYEPVWAIGTGKTASPEQAQAVHAFIRGKIAALDASVAESVQIVYGGSVKPDNAAEIFAQTDIDGGLIGGASLAANDFLGICLA